MSAMSPTNQKTFTFVLPDHLKAGLRALRDRDGVSEAEQIRRAIAMWLRSEDIKVGTAKRRVATRRKA